MGVTDEVAQMDLHQYIGNFYRKSRTGKQNVSQKHLLDFTDCEHNMSTEKCNLVTLHTLHKAVEGTGYIQLTERNSKMTCRSDSRVTTSNILSTGGDISRDLVQFI